MERTRTGSAYAVAHPHVRLPVLAPVGLAGDLERGERVREDVRAALGQRKLDPLLPLGHRPRDVQRARNRLEDLGAEADVEADPGVERETVLSLPRRIAVDGRERVALLPRRAERRDQAAEAAPGRDVAHAADHRPRAPPSLVAGRD